MRPRCMLKDYNTTYLQPHYNASQPHLRGARGRQTEVRGQVEVGSLQPRDQVVGAHLRLLLLHALQGLHRERQPSQVLGREGPANQGFVCYLIITPHREGKSVLEGHINQLNVKNDADYLK